MLLLSQNGNGAWTRRVQQRRIGPGCLGSHTNGSPVDAVTNMTHMTKGSCLEGFVARQRSFTKVASFWG